MSSPTEREARRDLSASVPGSVPGSVQGSVPGCLRLRARAGRAQQDALSEPRASPGARCGRSHPLSPHTLGPAGGSCRRLAWLCEGLGRSRCSWGRWLRPVPSTHRLLLSLSPGRLALLPSPTAFTRSVSERVPIPHRRVWFIPGSAAPAGAGQGTPGHVPAGAGDVRGRGGPVLGGGVGAAGGTAAGAAPGGDGGDIPAAGLPW